MTPVALFAPDLLVPPWWAVLAGNIATAAEALCKAEAERKAQERQARLVVLREQDAARQEALPAVKRCVDCGEEIATHARCRVCRGKAADRARRSYKPKQTESLPVLPDAAVPMPATRAVCNERPRLEDGEYRGGVCPVLRCKWNMLVDIRSNGETETITVGGRGGKGDGVSLPIKRSGKGTVRMADLDRIVEAIVERADKLPSSCMWDYVENADLLPNRDAESEDATAYHWRPHMTLQQVADVLGVTREAVRVMEIRALQKARMAREAVELDPEHVPDVPVSRVTKRR